MARLALGGHGLFLSFVQFIESQGVFDTARCQKVGKCFCPSRTPWRSGITRDAGHHSRSCNLLYCSPALHADTHLRKLGGTYGKVAPLLFANRRHRQSSSPPDGASKACRVCRATFGRTSVTPGVAIGEGIGAVVGATSNQFCAIRPSCARKRSRFTRRVPLLNRTRSS